MQTTLLPSPMASGLAPSTPARCLRRTLILVLLLVAAARPVHASALFVFTHTSSTPAGALVVSGSVQVSDDVYAAGLDVHETMPLFFEPPVDWAAVGIEALSFTVASPADASTFRTFTLAHLTPDPVDALFRSWEVSLASPPGGVPTGSVVYNDSEFDVALALAGVNSTGTFNTDDSSFAPCHHTGVCSFTGSFAASVPEPAALLLVALGLLAAAGRRHRRSFHAAPAPPHTSAASSRP